MVPTDSIHHRTCNLCEAMCGLEIVHAEGRVKKISGDRKDAFSRGYHCIKAEALQDLHEDPQRLKHPVRRTATGWEEISWNEAFDAVASNFERIQAAHGRDAVASYVGNPNVHNYGSIIFLPELISALRSKNRFAATSVDQLPHHLVAYALFGHQLMLPVPDLDRTQYLLIFGGNPVVSRGSMMTAPDITERLKAIRERGGKVFLFDPRRTETAQVVDAHHFIRPGTDAFFLLGVLKIIFAESLARPGRLAAIVEGVDRVKLAVESVALDDIARATGIGVEVMTTIAREFAASPAAIAYGRIGTCTQEFGALTQWLLTVLNVVTGNLDRAGGAMFTSPAVDPLPFIARGHFAKWRSRVRGLPEFAGELPVSCLADEILTPGEGQVRALLTVAGNPVRSTPNGQKMERALASLDFIVAIDPYINATTRFANFILPPTIGLEHENYDIAFHLLAIRNTAKFSPTLFPPAPNARHDWQIMKALIRRLRASRKKGMGQRLRRMVAFFLRPETIVDLGLRFGSYGSGFSPFKRGLTLRKVRQAPHGIDLGPLVPRLPGRLFTRDKRIDLAPDMFVQDLPRLFARLDPRATGEFDLSLIGRRQVRTNNSWMGHVERLTKGRSTCTAFINRVDAAARGIATGDFVKVTSRIGCIELAAVVIDTVMSGVISIPHGFGSNRIDKGDAVGAQPTQGVSVNDLTDETFFDALSGNAALTGMPVKVEKI